MNHGHQCDDAHPHALSMPIFIANTIDNTPEHCHKCWKLADCHQAQNMTAVTEPVSGFVETEKYVDYFCADCLPDDCPDETTFPMDNEETDSPNHCSVCGIPLIHSLTSDGASYVRQAIAEGAGCCRELWPVIWSDYLPPEPYFDKFDIAEAHYLYARLYGEYETITRLHKMSFSPGLSLIQHDRPELALTENGQAIFYKLISRKQPSR
jgi:hypothetical protein